jgi:sulfide:quinone oxidoreductase
MWEWPGLATFWGMRTSTRLLIAGGGVAALEAAIALRELAEERISVELLSPTAEFRYRPLAVAEPFGSNPVMRYDLLSMADDLGAGGAAPAPLD